MDVIFIIYISLIPIYFVFNLFLYSRSSLDVKQLNFLYLIDFHNEYLFRALIYIFLFLLALFISINWLIHLPLMIFFIITYKEKLAFPQYTNAVANFFPLFHVLTAGNVLLVLILGGYLLSAEFILSGYILFLLLAISIACFLASFLFSSTKLIDYVKLRNKNVYTDFLLIALFTFLSVLMCAFFWESIIYQLPLNFDSLYETFSNLFFYKKIRSYSWGYIDSIQIIDLFIVLLGFLFTSSIIKYATKIKRFRRTDEDNLLISEFLIALGKNKKADEALDRVRIKNEEYYQYKAYVHLGTNNFDEALSFAKQALPSDNHFSLDHCYDYLQMHSPYYMLDQNFLEDFFIKWIGEVENDVFLIRAMVYQVAFLQNLDEEAIDRIYSYADEEQKNFEFSTLVFEVLGEDDLSLLEDYEVKYPFEAIYIFEMKCGYFTEFELGSYVKEHGKKIPGFLTEKFNLIANEFIQSVRKVDSLYELELAFSLLEAYKTRINKYTNQFDDIFQNTVETIIEERPELSGLIESIDKRLSQFLNNFVDHHMEKIKN